MLIYTVCFSKPLTNADEQPPVETLWFEEFIEKYSYVHLCQPFLLQGYSSSIVRSDWYVHFEYKNCFSERGMFKVTYNKHKMLEEGLVYVYHRPFTVLR